MIGIGGQISTKNQIVLHSQQCMLHGDSWPNLKQIYFDSFNLSASRQAVFGYLDHPLSSRYDLGGNPMRNRLKHIRNYWITLSQILLLNQYLMKIYLIGLK